VRDFAAGRKYCGFVRPSYESQTSSYRRRIVLVKTALVTGSMTNDCFVHQQAYLMNDVLPLYPVSTQLGADDAASRYAPHQLASVLTGISARVCTLDGFVFQFVNTCRPVQLFTQSISP